MLYIYDPTCMTVLRHSDCAQFSEQFSVSFDGSDWI